MAITEQLLFGFVSSLIGGLAGYVLFLEKRHTKKERETEERHAKERRELIDMHKQQFDQISEISEEGHKVTRENSNILSGLKTLLENQRRNER